MAFIKLNLPKGAIEELYSLNPEISKLNPKHTINNVLKFILQKRELKPLPETHFHGKEMEGKNMSKKHWDSLKTLLGITLNDKCLNIVGIMKELLCGNIAIPSSFKAKPYQSRYIMYALNL